MIIPKILVMPGSIRSGSLNTRLTATITKELAAQEADVNRISLADFDLPIYNGDLEADKGIPDNARKLGRLFCEHQGIVIVTPEYNGSLPPLLKHALDWISRDLGNLKPYKDRTFAVASCSPGGMAGLAAQRHLRDVLISVGADFVTPSRGVGSGHSAFDDNDNLTNERQQMMLKNMTSTLLERANLWARG